MPHWKTILDGAGDFLFLLVMRISTSFQETVYDYDFVHVFMLHTDCALVYICVCKCDSFACLQSSISFQPLHLVGRAFPVCCVSPTCQIEQGGTHSSLIMTWHVRRVGWLWQWEGERGGREGSVGKGGSSRRSRLYSHLIPQGTTHQLELT